MNRIEDRMAEDIHLITGTSIMVDNSMEHHKVMVLQVKDTDHQDKAMVFLLGTTVDSTNKIIMPQPQVHKLN